MDLTAHHIGIVVSNLARSKAFYGALGFEQGDEHDFDDKTISFMRLGGIRIELFAYRAPVPAAELPERVRGFRHLALETSDIDAALVELKELGLVARDASILELAGGWRLLFFRDPDGVEIEIMQA